MCLNVWYIDGIVKSMLVIDSGLFNYSVVVIVGDKIESVFDIRWRSIVNLRLIMKKI